MINEDEIINLLNSDEYYKVKKYINELISNDHFISQIIKIDNPFVFDHFIKMCEYKIDTSVLYEKRNKFIQKTILSLNKDNICEFFHLNSSDKTLANRYLTEYIVGYYFHDNYYNFMTNFYQMINYLRSTKKILIDKKNIKTYDEFANLNNLSFDDKKNLFNKYLDNNLIELFYDDMNTVREDSYKELVDKSLKLNHDNNIYYKDISRRLGIDVYYLDGEEFLGFVRCLSINRGDLTDHLDYVNSNDNRLGYSFSYIGNNNIGTSDYDGKSVTLFYDNIDYENIMYVHHADLHAKKMVVQDDYLSEKENEIVTPQSLVAKTKNYNEIYIKRSDNGIKPTALVCYDNITKNDISFAEKYNLSILLINREKYKNYNQHEDDYDDYTYNI